MTWDSKEPVTGPSYRAPEEMERPQPVAGPSRRTPEIIELPQPTSNPRRTGREAYQGHDREAYQASELRELELPSSQNNQRREYKKDINKRKSLSNCTESNENAYGTGQSHVCNPNIICCSNKKLRITNNAQICEQGEIVKDISPLSVKEKMTKQIFFLLFV